MYTHVLAHVPQLEPYPSYLAMHGAKNIECSRLRRLTCRGEITSAPGILWIKPIMPMSMSVPSALRCLILLKLFECLVVLLHAACPQVFPSYRRGTINRGGALPPHPTALRAVEAGKKRVGPPRGFASGIADVWIGGFRRRHRHGGAHGGGQVALATTLLNPTSPPI